MASPASRAIAIPIVLAFAACANTSPPPAQTQPPAPQPLWLSTPRLPSAFDFDAVPVGSWAEYEEALLGTVTSMRRIAVVAKGTEGITVETTYWGGRGFGRDRVVCAAVHGPGKNGSRRTGKIVCQVNQNPPTEEPVDDSKEKPIQKPSPDKLVGMEQVLVRAGTFIAKHYRDESPLHERLDYWIDESVLPLGLVKLTSEQKQISQSAGFSYELTATGNDAQPEIKLPPNVPTGLASP